MRRILLGLLICCFLSISYAGGTEQPLPADKAFFLTGALTTNNELILEWHIAPGYYLYRDKVTVTAMPANNAKFGDVTLPAGIQKKDALHGLFQAFTDSAKINLPLAMPSAGQDTLALKVSYQGCSSAGFCYPPIKRYLNINLSAVTTPADISANLIDPKAIAKPAVQSDQNYATQLLSRSSHNYLLMEFGFLILGLLLAFTPCMLPMVPILSSIIVGQGKTISTKKAFALSLSYVLGMALAYAAAGVIVAMAGSSIQVMMQKPAVIAVFSSMFVLLALSLFGLFELRLPNAVQQRLVLRSNKNKGGTYFSVFLMGAFSTLIVSPCVSAPLVGVLAYIANSGDIVLGAVSLLFLGLGMGIPLLLIGASAGKLLPKTGAWMEKVKQVFGLLMLGLAIWMLERVLPGAVILFLWSLLAIGTAVFIWKLHRSKRMWRMWHQGLGLVVLSYGFILMGGAILGHSDPFYLLQNPALHLAVAEKANFAVVKNMEQLDQQLTQAKNNKQEVLLDFYADWCTSCVVMDHSVFTKPQIKDALSRFVLLRADVTQDNAFDQALLQRFHVVAPPTIVFFDADGNALPKSQIVGEVNISEFLSDIQKLNYCQATKTSSC